MDPSANSFSSDNFAGWFQLSATCNLKVAYQRYAAEALLLAAWLSFESEKVLISRYMMKE